MATAIPSSMTFEMLSRLPPNSFVQTWKEIRPSVGPSDGKYRIGASSQRISFALRGAPNEFLLNTDTYLTGTGYTMAKYLGNAPADDFIGLDASGKSQRSDLVRKVPTRFRAPFHFFQASRESFNSGSLPYLDNQDIQTSHEFNELRKAMVKRAPLREGGPPADCQSWAAASTEDGAMANGAESTSDKFHTSDSFRGIFPANAGAVESTVVLTGKNKEFRIPLGMYSNLVNTHSVVPLGLMSSYSVNGWQIDLDLQTQTPSTVDLDGIVMTTRTGLVLTGLDAAVPPASTVRTYNVDLAVPPTAVLRDLRIYACVIKVLDPSVMEAVLSLYEKREMVNVGGVQFPLSLRLNSLGFRMARFPLTTATSDYYFRITGTDRSVRALAWRVFSSETSTKGKFYLPQTLQLTRLETTIGSEQPHPVIEDTTPNTSNVNNFIQMNVKRSAALFSPLPYYQEGVLSSGDYADDWAQCNNLLVQTLTSAVATPYTGAPPYGVTVAGAAGTPVGKASQSMGMISFENMDRREGDFSGSFQATGKDLTNVGAIEVRMRFQQVDRPVDGAPLSAVNTADALMSALEGIRFKAPDTLPGNYSIVFAYVYDNVMEISPQGVMDITNAIL